MLSFEISTFITVRFNSIVRKHRRVVQVLIIRSSFSDLANYSGPKYPGIPPICARNKNLGPRTTILNPKLMEMQVLAIITVIQFRNWTRY